ncbi:fluoride efflux transporter CrcB [Marinospirillum insulare]|uniref:Fluoride-specific ion channel FluC n=1 Tax=Marinospirillum insulare TaxID=217169 RepID=A0ABQ5ZXU4_9GAMM|nr:fluoride efflux transporter CrcB [Marinospirillum insulare]GLR63481.1 putative fluoride ion transporter CrcB [Marinospirillum insulare]
MNLLAALAVAAGASCGALGRWWLSLQLNTSLAFIPLGTLLANLIGGYFIGLALAFFAQNPNLSPEWRLFLVTGLLGGLTTFSTFSAEIFSLLQQGRYIWALLGVAGHLLGSLLMTALGFFTYSSVKGFF